MKLQSGNQGSLEDDEKVACEKLRITASGSPVLSKNIENMSFKERYSAKRRRITAACDSYMDLSFIPG